MLANVLVGLLLSTDGGISRPDLTETTQLRVYDANFDGRVLTALMLVCAGDVSTYLNSDLSFETFQVLGVTGCQKEEPLRHLTADAAGGRVRTLKVSPNTCVGRAASIRLTENESRPLGNCVRVKLGAQLLSANGKFLGFARTVHTFTTR